MGGFSKPSKNIIIAVFFIILLLAGNLSIDAAGNEIALIPLHGDVNPGQTSFLARALSEVEEGDFSAVIVEIDTYGGLVDSAINIRDQLLEYEMPVITYVNQRAWSAGALIALAGDSLYMRTGSSMGAAETRPKEEKFIAAFSGEFAATAERQGRDPEIARAMVDIEVEIDSVVNKGRLLSLTASEAAEIGFISGQVNNLEELFQVEGWSKIEATRMEKSTLEVIAGVITSPAVSILLLTLGLVGLVGEAMIPGFGVSGTVGILSLSLFFSSYLYQGYAGIGLLLLFMAGILLIIIEVFFIPGFGFTGIGGLAAIFLSLYLFIPDPSTALRIIVAVLVLSLLGIFILIKIFGASDLWKRISMEKSETVEEGYIARSSEENLTGESGKTLTPLRPSGMAKINERRIDVVTEGDFIDKDEKIEVIQHEGRRVVVSKKERE